MNTSERTRATVAHRAAIESARTTTIAALWHLWAGDMLLDDLPPHVVDMVRAAFYEGAWRVSENFATVAIDVRQKLIADMAETLVAEAFVFDDSPEARRAFAPESGGTA